MTDTPTAPTTARKLAKCKKPVKRGRPPGLEKRFKVITPDDVRKAYMTWEWDTQEELARQIGEKYRESVSPQYISKLALKGDWDTIRTNALAGTGPRFLANIQQLSRDAAHFDELECLKGFKSRLLKRMSAEITSHPNPEFFKGMMDVYHAVHKAIADTWEYKLRAHNTPGNDDAAKVPTKAELKEGVPQTVSAQIAPFKRRP